MLSNLRSSEAFISSRFSRKLSPNTSFVKAIAAVVFPNVVLLFLRPLTHFEMELEQVMVCDWKYKGADLGTHQGREKRSCDNLQQQQLVKDTIPLWE